MSCWLFTSSIVQFLDNSFIHFGVFSLSSLVFLLRDRLRNEELVAGSFFSRLRYHRTFRHEPTSDVDHRRVMCAHARILALEEAIDTEWVYMWDKFGGYLLLLLGLTSKAEQAQVMDI